MSASLLPCPFCAAGETIIQPQHYWTGMSNKILSVEVRHWCKETTGVRGSHVTMRAKTEDEAVAKWNRRASQPNEGHL